MLDEQPSGFYHPRILRIVDLAHPASSMPTTETIFTLLGPLFLLLGAGRCVAAGRLVPQGKTWLIVGLIFTAVALWLRWSHPPV